MFSGLGPSEQPNTAGVAPAQIPVCKLVVRIAEAPSDLVA